MRTRTPADPVYLGRPSENGLRVVRPDGRKLDERLDLARHSPTGFACGYGGSGPAQLALALLADRFPDVLAMDYYQQFKDEVVSKLDPDGWDLPALVVEGYIPETEVANAGPSTDITQCVGEEPVGDGTTRSYTYYRCEACGAEAVDESMPMRGCPNCESEDQPEIVADGGEGGDSR